MTTRMKPEGRFWNGRNLEHYLLKREKMGNPGGLDHHTVLEVVVGGDSHSPLLLLGCTLGD